MRILISTFCAIALLVCVGCEQSGPSDGTPVATTEDEFAAYDAMLEEMQEETAADEAAEGEANQ